MAKTISSVCRWRSNELTLEECRAECLQHETCIGVEFEDTDGSSDCIMLRAITSTYDAAGFTIWARPAALNPPPAAPTPPAPPVLTTWPMLAADSRVADPDEARDEAPWEWR
eukprot:SAG31_NODE_12942_length_905_cov_1.088089_1_plen_111_part_10